MNVDVSNLSFNELVELRDKINGLIWEYNDGHVYICKVRSYGRNWTERIDNVSRLRDLCYDYDGENGIVDIYTTNTDLGEDFYNYGSTKVIKSLEDYEKWNNYNSLTLQIQRAEDEIREDAENQERPFNMKSSHSRTFYTQDIVDGMKEKLKDLPMDFEPPRNYFQYSDGE